MAVKLNLLPQDYAVSDSVVTVLKIVRPLNVILLGLFLASAVGMAGFFIISSITIKNLDTANNTIKSQIKSQQTAQQQIVLLKDRLGKIKKVYNTPSAVKNLSAISPILTALPSTVSVPELNIDVQKTNLSLNFMSNSDLTNFMDSLNTATAFSNISLDSFNYNPSDGYVVGLSFVLKN